MKRNIKPFFVFVLFGVAWGFTQSAEGNNIWPFEIRAFNPFVVAGANPNLTMGVYFDKVILNVPLIMPMGANLTVSGTLDVTGVARANSFVTPSDLRLKKDIKKLSGAREKLASIQGVYYKLRAKSDKNRQHLGFIAQEVEKVFPELVVKDAKGVRGVAYSQFVVPLSEAVREQQSEIDRLQSENKALKDRLEKIENLLGLGTEKQLSAQITKEH